MVQIDKKKYYNKKEIAERLHCTVATINNKIVKSKVKGYYFGHFRYFTEEQIRIIAECRTYQPTPKYIKEEQNGADSNNSEQ